MRDNAVGRIVVLDGIFTKKSRHENLEQIILTETLCYCLAKDYNYAVYRNIIEDYPDDKTEEVLELQGFQGCISEIPAVFIVDMGSPCTINLDISSVIKETFRNAESVKRSIIRSGKGCRGPYRPLRGSWYCPLI